MSLDKYTNLKKKFPVPFFRKSKKKKKNFPCKFQLPLFRFQPKACCTPSSIYRAKVSNFVALRLMVAKRKGLHTYIHISALTNGFLVTFWPLGTTISNFIS